MGKKGKGSSSGGGAKKAPKCTCEHLFKCDCGNRPERPSRGHKWDPEKQEWGGKGHKQKGGSGQTSQVAKAAQTTARGNTTMEQWQKLPSTLLADICKKEKRPPPKYKALNGGHGANRHLFRVIVQDAKQSRRGGDHDLIFVPRSGVSNEEQAKEESALLGLLHMTPTIPHERKLPDPYKTTWLNALAAKKEMTQKQTKANVKSSTATNNGNNGDKKPKASTSTSTSIAPKTTTTTSSSRGGAVASSNLFNANSFVSKSENRKQREEKIKAKRDRIRRHENERMANRDVQVFMSTQIRKQIEILLRGDADDELMKDLISENDNDDRDDHDNDNDDKRNGEEKEEGEDEDDFIQSYVTERLTHEGFTKKQARAGFKAVSQNPSTLLQSLSVRASDEDEYMDKVYEESLQWLCVHMDEDQLPEGFDPRGRTLSVITTKSNGRGGASPGESEGPGSGNDADNAVTKDAKRLIRELGVSLEEATLISKSVVVASQKKTAKDIFWTSLCKLTKVESSMFEVPSSTSVPSQESLTEEQKDENKELAAEEVEVLRAIFPEDDDLHIKTLDSGQEGDVITQIDIVMAPIVGNEKRIMSIQYFDGLYPMIHPRVMIMGDWDAAPFKQGYGTAFHSDLIKFISELPREEPMIFELFNYAQELLQSSEETFGNSVKVGPQSSLVPFLEGGEEYLKIHSKISTSQQSETQRNMSLKNKNRNSGNSAPSVTSGAHIRKRNATKSFFWSKRPRETPPAIAFPKLPTLIGSQRKRLPANTARKEFLEVMEKADRRDRVVLVTGETGCGKTTQIPQFILEESPRDAKIVIAQPRRLAATGVAERVANERGENSPGVGSVGYAVRGDVKMCNNTRLMFCTTGILLRQLQCEGALNAVTHIVIDEVHERHLDTDILLALLKETRPPHLRVVLMSATMDADRFAAYWGADTPRMHIPGFTHPVKDFSLKDVLQLTGYIPPKKGKKKKRGNWKTGSTRKKTAWNDSEISDDEDETVNPAIEVKKAAAEPVIRPDIPIEDLVARVNSSDIDYDMLAILVDCLIKRKEHGDDGSILVFLPGAGEIARAQETILKITKGVNMKILPLHGGLQPSQQKIVFDKASFGVTKVILSTNVAETSITIPDCTIVVDTCREKQSSYDPSNRMPMLIEKFASRDSLKQRRGRAGRVRPGCCYKLISLEQLSELQQHLEPEIKRCALDQTLLSLMFLGVEEGSGDFLSKLIDPPSQISIDAAIYSLEKIGALVSSNSGKERRASLTPLGLHLAGIPAPPSVGKMLVMGALLGCRSASLAISAGLSAGRSPFLKVMDRGEDDKDAYRNKLVLQNRSELFESVGNSDHAMLAAVYLNWDEMGGGGGSKKRYCESLGVSPQGMRDMKTLFRQLDSSLSSAGFKFTKDSDMNAKSWRIIRSCIVSALAPTQIVRVQRASTKFAETSEGAVEKDGKAKELKFFARGNDDDSDTGAQPKNIVKFYHGIPEERCFVHPGSANFSVGHYSCPWLVYYQLVRTSKPFMRDLTECSNYDLLLFGGNIEVLAADGLIIVDGYVRMNANARIGALVGGLRRKVDDLLSKKITNPRFEVAKSVEMKLIVKLLRTDGMG